MRENGRIRISTIFNIILIVIAGYIIINLWHTYKLNDFGDFVKAEYISGISDFTRDDEVLYSEQYSYKIESDEYNDALIYKTVEVEENTVYRVTAMVKFEGVENEKSESEGGVNIGIVDTTEKSDSLTGTGEWQLLTFEFDSKSRTSVDIAFRLGSYDDNSKGTVWFSNFTLEKGEADTSNSWNFICLIIRNIDVEIEENGVTKIVKTSLESDEIKLIESNMKRFKTSMNEMSRRINECNIYNYYDR